MSHAIAPHAHILLVEAKSASVNDMLSAVTYVAKQPGVSVVSMSFGVGEFAGETGYDSVFTTPANHPGVTFVAASGDYGAPPSYLANAWGARTWLRLGRVPCHMANDWLICR
jgi:subtilase family serine protease